MNIETKCEQCNNSFKRKNSTKDKKRFCSKECFLNSVRKKKEVICYVCEKKYIPTNRQSKVAIKNYCPDCRGTEEINCPVCQKTFKQRKSNIRKRKNLCCSVECKSIHQRKEWNELSRGSLKHRWISEFGIENFKCNRCQHDKEFNIVLHHVKYVKNGGDNQPDNLEPLCLNCHGIEHYENGLDEKE